MHKTTVKLGTAVCYDMYRYPYIVIISKIVTLFNINGGMPTLHKIIEP